MEKAPLTNNTHLSILFTRSRDALVPWWAEVAQVVEQRTENPRVGSSTLPLGTLRVLSSLATHVSSFNQVAQLWLILSVFVI